MAPESIRDPNSVDARTDIYSLGVVAYYLLAGVDVFNGKTVMEVCGQHLHQEPASLSSRGIEVPADLEAVVLQCLSKDPARRPQTAAELRKRVEACQVRPWDADRARIWWRNLKATLERKPATPTGGARTLAIDAAHRADLEDAPLPYVGV
jgi:eukaryotic-like serine/threonine-protein kinase